MNQGIGAGAVCFQLELRFLPLAHLSPVRTKKGKKSVEYITLINIINKN